MTYNYKDHPRYKARLFPFTTVGSGFTCNECDGNGWGPMLENSIWELVKPIPVYSSKEKCLIAFLCQRCMEQRLGRKLILSDLKDCPMNALLIEEMRK